MISRVAGEGSYARPEREQRWLLRFLPDDVRQPVSIVDHYLPGTRLRLRRVRSGDEVTYKLGQKVRPDSASPALVKITNIYLSEDEYTTLLALGGDEVHKTRWHCSTGDRALAVDEFGGALVGLILAETELGPDEPRLEGLPFMVADVTDDDRFSGGRLARMSPSDWSTLRAAMYS